MIELVEPIQIDRVVSHKLKNIPFTEKVKVEEKEFIFPIILVVPDTSDCNLILPRGLDVSATPLLDKVIPPFPLRTKPEDNFENIRAILI